MKKTFIISAAAALLLAGAALTAMSVSADKTDSLTEKNIEALAEGEASSCYGPKYYQCLANVFYYECTNYIPCKDNSGCF